MRSQPISNPSQQLRLAIAMGDPAGIGPEVILKSLADSSIRDKCQITVIGTRSLLEQAYDRLRKLPTIKKNDLANPDEITIRDVSIEKTTIAQIAIGNGNAASGEASFTYLEEAIALTQQGEFQGIVTAPIAKSCWKAAGHDFPGQTEVLAHRAGVEKFGMLFVARSPYTNWTLRTLLATTHIPLNRVSTTLTPELMTLKLDLLLDCLSKDFGIDRPQIAIAGLNPHSGEQGQLGTEERDWLIPWLEAERQKRPHVKLIGPIPPDTMWVTPGQAWYGDRTNYELRITNYELPVTPGQAWYGDRDRDAADAYLALYHDQGLIPVKLMAFDRAINTTIGLPFVRTSPDHGTAFDIAQKGVANASSMKAAIELAVELVRQRSR